MSSHVRFRFNENDFVSLSSYSIPIIPVMNVAYGHGVLRSTHVKTEMHPDIVPVDLVINLLCAVARKTAMKHSGMSVHPL